MRIQLAAATVIDDLLSGLNSTANIENIDISFENSFAEKGEQELSRLISALNSCPHLSRIAFSSEGHHYYSLPITAVSTALNTAIGINEIVLDRIEVNGSSHDFAALGESLRRHSSLNQLHLTCWLSENTRVSIDLDPLARAIAASTTLQSIYIKPTFVFSDLSSTVAGMLCTCPRLQSLNVHNCGLSDEHIEAMALVLEENHTLTELYVSCNLGEGGSLALARCLRNNNSLDVLSIHNTVTGRTTDSNDEYNIELAQALRTNSSLTELALHGVALSQSSQRAFADVLAEDNLTLRSLSLVDAEEEVQKEIDMYTALNASGRGYLLNDENNAGRQVWVEALGRISGDLDCLFYFLSIKPSLFDLPSTGAIGKRKSDVQLDEGTKRKRPSHD